MLSLAPTIAVFFSSSLCASTQQASFQGLGELAGGASFSFARGLSADGGFIAGISQGANGIEAFRWDATGGMIGLGDLLGGLAHSEANAVDPSGVVCGFASVAEGQVAFSWSPSSGMRQEGYYYPSALDDMPSTGGPGVGFANLGMHVAMYMHIGGLNFQWPLTGYPNPIVDRAHGIAASGAHAVGQADLPAGMQACQWPDIYGEVRELLELDSYSSSVALNCSTDGRYVVGHVTDAGGNKSAAAWFHGDLVPLVDPTGSIQTHEARAVSGRAERIVGSNATGLTPWIWDTDNGVRNLRDVMETEYSLDLTGWLLIDVVDISGDAQTLAGNGINPQGNVEAWIARLPFSCRADLNRDGVINLSDVGDFTTGFTNQEADGDFDGNGLFNVADVGDFTLAFNTVCPHTSGGGVPPLFPHVPQGDPDNTNGGDN